MIEVKFTESDVVVRDYPYPPSTCYPGCVLPATEVLDISPQYPVTFRLRRHDVLFVSKTLDAESRTFAQRNDIPIIHRYDPWSFVLEPLLDTEYPIERDSKVLQILQQNGVTPAQCREWRKRFKAAITSYNFDSMLWEWCSLGATDLLDAHLGILARRKFKLPERKFAELYGLVIDVLFNAAEIPPEIRGGR